jgi:regulatory protein
MPSLLSPEKLYARALHYLERYAASAAGVRGVLRRGLLRDARRGEVIPEQASQWIDDVIACLIREKYLDDVQFSDMRVRSLRRSGASALRVRQKMAVKGVAAPLVETALAGEGVVSERAAAVIFARKRRLGPYTSRGDRAELRDKQLQALARAGFALDICRWIVDADADTKLDDSETE